MIFIYTILCIALSGAAFYFSNGLGEVWPAAWIAALPILWLAYGKARAPVGLAAFVAYAIGQANMVVGYWGHLPVGTLIIIMLIPPAAFAGCVLFGRFAARRLNPFLAALAFPALWTTWEFIVAANSPDGTAGSFAYSQAGVPEMIQTASLFGPFVISFLLMLNSSLLAMALRTPVRQARVLAGVALILFGANVLFGLYRINNADTAEKVRVAMIDSDELNDAAFSSDGVTALRAVHSYITAARTAIQSGAKVVVMPEKIAVVEPAWRYDTFAALQQLADTSKVTVVAGFDLRGETRRNVAMVFQPNTHSFQYEKRHMVPGLEDAFQPGIASGVFAPGRGVAVCKDMDFQGTMREDATAHTRIVFVPAWDFGADGWAHARMAILRGVEGGYAVVRSARMGYVTATDAHGRLIAGAPTIPTGFVSVLADVPLGPGDTIYVRIGDVFAWGCVGLTLFIVVVGLMFRRREVAVAEAASSPAASDSAKG